MKTKTLLMLGGWAWMHALAYGQTAPPVLVSTAALPARKCLHVAYGLTNAEYRQQLLALTPPGSSYEQVAAFTRAELYADNPRVPEWLVRLDTTLHHKPALVNPRLFREEPPRTRMVAPTSTSNDRVGTDFTTVWFATKPNWWRSSIIVDVTYVFDGGHKLIDVFCVAGPPNDSL